MTYNRHNLGLLIKMRRTELNLTQEQLASMIGIGRAAINAIENGHSTAPLDRIITLNQLFGINLIDNDIITREEDGITQEEYEAIVQNKDTARLGEQIQQIATSKDEKNRFIALPNGKLLLAVDLVEPHAEAGFLSQFSDVSYREDIPKHFILINKEDKGEYLAWVVRGDSMTDGTVNSIPNKSVAIGKKIKRDLWRSKFHLHQWKYYIIVHKLGIICKEIVSHDTEKGIIHLHALNPDKEYYPDRAVHLDDCYAIYYIVDKVVSVV